MIQLFQNYLQELLDACQIRWYAAYRHEFGRPSWQADLMNGWKVFDVVYSEGSEKNFSEESKAYFQKAKQHGDVDPQVAHAVANTGVSRTHLITEAIAPDEWRHHWMRQVLLAAGVGERMVGAFTLSEGAESYFLVDRPPGVDSFTRTEADLLLAVMKDFPRLHYWLFLERGLVTPSCRPFSPREQDVLRLLLGPDSEAEIADQLSLSKGTVHGYVTDIYRNLSVRSRYEMVQLWLRNAPGAWP